MSSNSGENGIRSGGMSILSESVERLDLSVRASNCMRNYNIVLVRDLVRKTREELSRQPNVGKKTIREIENALANFNLRLGMSDVDITALQHRGQHLNVFIDTVIAIKNNGIDDVDELIQLTTDELMDAPYNLDKQQLAAIEDGLTKWGLSLNTVIPDSFSSQITCLKDVNNFREELLCVVKKILSSRPASWTNCFVSYYGLDGRPTITYEEIGNRAIDFGFDGAVTRERVRQVISRAGDQIKRRADDVNFTQWDECVECSRKTRITSVESFLSMCGYDTTLNLSRAYRRVRDILTLFRVNFPFDLIDLGGSQFVIGADDRPMKDVLDAIQNLPSDLYHSVAQLSREIACDDLHLSRAVDAHPRWEFLDDDRHYIWRKPTLPPASYVTTGNAILSSLCKIFSATKIANSRDLINSISRDRGVQRDMPIPVLEGIAKRSGLFDVRSGKISRRRDRKWFTLGERDKALVKICLDNGQTVSSNVLYSSLIRHNLSSENAALTVSYSPLLIHVQAGRGTREGIYKFVFTPEDVESIGQNPDQKHGGGGVKDQAIRLSEVYLRIKVSARVLLRGYYSMSEKRLSDGEWRIVTVEGEEIGSAAISGKLVKGLKKVISAMELEKGDVVELRRGEGECVLVATKEAEGVSDLGN